MAYFNNSRAAVLIDVFFIPGLGSLLLGGNTLRSRAKQLLLWWAITLCIAVFGGILFLTLALVAPGASIAGVLIFGGGLLANIGVRLWAIISGVPIMVKSFSEDRKEMQKLPLDERRKKKLFGLLVLVVGEAVLLGLFLSGVFDSLSGSVQYLVVKWFTVALMPLGIVAQIIDIWWSSRRKQ